MTDAALKAESGLQPTEFASRRTLVLRRFLRSPAAVASVVVLLLLFVGCYALPSFLPYSYTDLDYNALLQPPNTRHWLGTNALGQDLLAQTLRGMQKSMLIAVCVAIISTGIAATVGSISGYFGGWRDRVLMWLVDLMLVVPGFILIMILSPRTKSSDDVIVLVLLLAAFGWMVSSRICWRWRGRRPPAQVASSRNASRSVLRETARASATACSASWVPGRSPPSMICARRTSARRETVLARSSRPRARTSPASPDASGPPGSGPPGPGLFRPGSPGSGLARALPGVILPPCRIAQQYVRYPAATTPCLSPGPPTREGGRSCSSSSASCSS